MWRGAGPAWGNVLLVSRDEDDMCLTLERWTAQEEATFGPTKAHQQTSGGDSGLFITDVQHPDLYQMIRVEPNNQDRVQGADL
jgi:hypothetical protein